MVVRHASCSAAPIFFSLAGTMAYISCLQLLLASMNHFAVTPPSFDVVVLSNNATYASAIAASVSSHRYKFKVTVMTPPDAEAMQPARSMATATLQPHGQDQAGASQQFVSSPRDHRHLVAAARKLTINSILNQSKTSYDKILFLVRWELREGTVGSCGLGSD